MEKNPVLTIFSTIKTQMLGKVFFLGDMGDKLASTCVPASFIHNALYTPNIVYTSKDSDGDIDTGFNAVGLISWCTDEGGGWSKIWDVADIRNPKWNHGVFYAHDSNSCEKRGRWVNNSYYDAPFAKVVDDIFTKDTQCKGSGNYSAGNPLINQAWGGGTGVHCMLNYDQCKKNPSWVNSYFNIGGGGFYNNYDCDLNVSKFSPSSCGRARYDGIQEWSKNNFLSLSLATVQSQYPGNVDQY